MEIDKIHLGDCLELTKEIPDKRIDCIICDLPYGTTACQWDIIIPFDLLWGQYKRIIKDNGAIILFCCQPFTSVLVNSNLKGYKHHWIWLKNRGTGFQIAKYRPMMKTEDIIVFTKKGEKVNYYPQMIKLDKPHFSRNASSSNGTNPLCHFNSGGKNVDSKYPTNVLDFSKVVKPVHPTQKPVELIRYLIRTYTNEGDLVLDNCVGSGTTAIAAIREKRHFIGMELNKEYYDIACKRIKKEREEIESSLLNELT